MVGQLKEWYQVHQALKVIRSITSPLDLLTPIRPRKDLAN